MALTFKFDEQQLDRLVTALNDLSANVAKWQGQEVVAIHQGFADMVSVLGGSPSEEVQARIDQLRDQVKTEADALEGSARSGD
jgi:hypothetical protein